MSYAQTTTVAFEKSIDEIIALVKRREATQIGQFVRKRKGSQWHGRVVGFYSTELNPRGYNVESYYEEGSVQIYPEAALEDWEA